MSQQRAVQECSLFKHYSGLSEYYDAKIKNRAGKVVLRRRVFKSGAHVPRGKLYITDFFCSIARAGSSHLFVVISAAEIGFLNLAYRIRSDPPEDEEAVIAILNLACKEEAAAHIKRLS